MKLIMNEIKYIENLIEDKNVEKGISDRYLIKMLVRYFRDTYDKKELVEHIHQLCKEFNIKYYKEYEFYDKIKKYLKEEESKPMQLRNLTYIALTQNELDVINGCSKDREKKFLFVCYIMARFNNSDWINIDDKDLFKMANISLSCKDRQLFMHDMIKRGYISQSKKNMNNSLKIQRLDGDEVVKVVDFNNMGNFILAYLKPNYIQCEKCGRLVKIGSSELGGRPKKYCKNCLDDVHVIAQQKYRERNR